MKIVTEEPTMLAGMVRAYQRHASVRAGVRTLVRLHHALTPRQAAARRPCPLAGQCSSDGLRRARLAGWAALPLLVTRMATCGPGVDRAEWCISMGTGVDRAEWCI